jgi:tetratricopeptide (TPR) repeat protein
MKKLMIRIIFITIGFLISLTVSSQESYETLFIKGDYDSILFKTKGLNNANDYYWNSLIADKFGKTLIAINVLNTGLKKHQNNQKLEKLLLDCLYKTGQYPLLKPLLYKYIDKSDVFVKLVNVLEFEGDYLQAISLLDAKIKTDSLNYEYLSQLGDNYNQIDSMAAAAKIFEKLNLINPSDQQNAYKLANLYLKKKDYEKTIDICDIVLLNDKGNKKFTRIKGIASFNSADFKLSADCFNKLLEQGDSGKFILKHLGISEYKNEMYKESKEHLLIAYKFDSKDFETTYYLGKAYINSPSPKAGLYYFNKVDSLLQPDPKVLSSLYFDKQAIYSALGNYQEALKCYEMAYKFDPKPEYLYYIASLYQYYMNNKKKAIEYYEKFLSQLPPKPKSENIYHEKQIIISLQKAAEDNIVILKEELFFKAGINNKK